VDYLLIIICFLFFFFFLLEQLDKYLSMASFTREWVGINTFASATQTKLLELLGKLKQEVLFLRPIFSLLTNVLASGRVIDYFTRA
jgi:hypothetical protein